MKIQIQLDGTPAKIREAITAILALNDPEGACYLYEWDAHAALILESAVKDGSATIPLAPGTYQKCTPASAEILGAARACKCRR